MAGRRSLAALVIAWVAVGSARADADAAADARRFDRIAGLCRVWTAAKYVHPALARRGIDWDGAFERAAMAVDGGDVQGYRDVAGRMLAELGDPATRVLPAEPEKPGPSSPPNQDATAKTPPAPVELVRRLGNGLVLVDFAGFERNAAGRHAAAELADKLPKALEGARGIVVDLRLGPGAEDATWDVYSALGDAAGQLVPRAVAAPGARWRTYNGYPTQRGDSSGDYWAGSTVVPGKRIEPAGNGGSWKVVFLVDADSPLPDVLWALVGSGDARLVGAEAVDDRNQLTFGVDFGEGVAARMRGWEALVAPLATVVVTTKGESDAVFDEAVRQLGTSWQPPGPPPTPAPIEELREDPYTEPRLPPPSRRLLAGCRAWGVIRYFYPYLGLIGDWDGAVRASLPELLAAVDEDAYARAVLRLMAQVADGHTAVTDAPAIGQIFGAAWPALRVDVVEGKAVVAAVDPALHGAAVGDVVESVDGEPIAARMQRLGPYIAAATEDNHLWREARAAVGGAVGSKRVLQLVGADGRARTVELGRGPAWSPARPEGHPWRRVEPRVGYVDLNFLRGDEVDAMLADLADTDALVLDMRGYPQGVFWLLAPRLNVRGARIAAIFRGRHVEPSTFAGDGGESGVYFEQRIDAAKGPLYRGKVVMLVNERSQSQAEHTALFVEAAAGATFVGSPTSGSNGDITYFPLPGGLWVRFGAHDVRHADGRQLQRVGIQPDVVVRPTIAGLRAGRDEVLERALATIHEQLSKSTKPSG